VQPSETEIKDFTESVGLAILEWQKVEMALFLIFNTLIGASDKRLSSAAFYSVVGLRTRLEMVNAVAVIALADSPLLTEWKALCTKISDLSKRRNALAHCTLASVTDINGKVSLRLRSSVFDVRSGHDREYDRKQIQDFDRSFGRLAARLDVFWKRLPERVAKT
jgi:hypothetical protein